MSESTVELVRAGYETFRTQHAAGVLNLFDENIEWLGWSGNTQLPGGGLFRGLPALMTEVFAKMGNTWQQFEFQPNRVIDADEQVIVSGRMHGVLRASGEKIDVPFVHIWTIKNGKAHRVELFTDTLAVHQGLTTAV